MTRWGTKPGSTLLSCTKLRTIRPAPISSMNEKATWAAINMLRNTWRLRSALVRLDSLRPEATSWRE